MSEAPVHVVLWDHQHLRLLVSTAGEALEANNGRFLDNQPALGVIRDQLTLEQAEQVVRAFRPLIEARIRGNGVLAA